MTSVVVVEGAFEQGFRTLPFSSLFFRACLGSIFGAIFPFGRNRRFGVHDVSAQGMSWYEHQPCIRRSTWPKKGGHPGTSTLGY